jgi:hypothetical protein
MLGNALQKKLSKRNWLRSMEDDSNPTQTWTRTRSKAERALKHLKLLADTLPDDKQEQIFCVEKICTLLESILRQPVWADPKSDVLDARRSRLAAAIAEKSLNKCINQYEKLERGKDLRDLVVKHLQQSIGLCSNIASKVGQKDEVRR